MPKGRCGEWGQLSCLCNLRRRLSAAGPDSRPHVLCKEVGSRLVAVAPALGAPLPAIILPVTQARCCSGRPPLREPLCGEQGRARPPSGSGAAGDSRVYVF